MSFQKSATSVSEDVGQVVVTLRRTGDVSGSTTVHYSVSNGSATSGEDYGTASPPSSVTFEPRVRKLRFSVPIVNDAVDESDETILLAITGTVPAGQVGSPASSMITIVDDDTPSGSSVLPDDLEGDTSGWSATGLWHLTDDSPCVDQNVQIPAYSSATHAFYFGQDSTCTYGDFDGVRAVGSLTSPTYTGVSGATRFTFQSLLLTEGDPCQSDIGSVDVSYDGGATWLPLGTCVPESRGEFSELSYIISPLGDTLRLRFTFDSIDGGLNDYPGWFVDDLSVGFEAPAKLEITEPNLGDFGSHPVRTETSSSFTVTNTGGRGSGALTYSTSGRAATDFAIDILDSSCRFIFELAPNESCVILVRFIPSDTGVRTASLDVVANEGNASFPLTGTGT